MYDYEENLTHDSSSTIHHHQLRCCGSDYSIHDIDDARCDNIFMNHNMRHHDSVNTSFKLSWMQLARTQNVGPRMFWELLNLFKTPELALARLPTLAKRGGNAKGMKCASKKDVEHEITETEKLGAHIILACDEAYPALLKEIHDPPPIIVIRGKCELLKKNKVAIVGARNASTNGCTLATKLASEVSNRDYIVVSGLARGIDAAAHIGSMTHGSIGVIAGGIDSVYPKENEHIYQAMYECGVVISEYFIGQAPLAKHFPQRNRIISGLCYGVVVVEAAQSSGTLITAKYALEQGREVLAIPGSPFDPRYKGTNALIKQGATLVECGDDIVTHLDGIVDRCGGCASNALADSAQKGTLSYSSENVNCTSSDLIDKYSDAEISKMRQTLINKIGYTHVSVEQLLRDTDIDMPILSLLLIELELAGRLERSRHGHTVCLLVDE